MKDWKGEKARMIRQKSNAAEESRQIIRDITRDLEEYGESDDEMSDGEKDEQIRLMREQKKAKFVNNSSYHCGSITNIKTQEPSITIGNLSTYLFNSSTASTSHSPKTDLIF